MSAFINHRTFLNPSAPATRVFSAESGWRCSCCVSPRMVRRGGAALLFLLAASPFTAPFATCDVATLFGRHDASIAGGWTSTSVIAEDRSQPTTLCSTAQRTRTPVRLSADGGPEAMPLVLFVPLRDGRRQAPIRITHPPIPLRI